MNDKYTCVSHYLAVIIIKIIGTIKYNNNHIINNNRLIKIKKRIFIKYIKSIKCYAIKLMFIY